MDDRWFTDYTPNPRWPHQTRANAGEVIPTPQSPLCQKFAWDNGIIHGAALGSVRTGLYELEEYDSEIPEIYGVYGGYFYINLSTIRMQAVRNPGITVEQLDLAFFGDHPDVPAYVEHPDDQKPHLLPKIEAHVAWVMSTSEWPQLDDDRAVANALRDGRPDLAELSDAALLERARSAQPLLVEMFSQHFVSSSSSGMAPAMLAAVGAAVDDPSVPMRLLAGLGDVDSAAPSYALWEMSRIVRASPEMTAAFDAGLEGLLDRLETVSEWSQLQPLWEGFIREFGSRGPNEWEFSAPTWETRPELALAAVDRVRHQEDDQAPQLRAEQLAGERRQLVAEMRERLDALGDEELSGMFEAALVGGNMMIFRERTKTTIVKVVHECRMVFLELGRRHYESGMIRDREHIWMLTDAELENFIASPGEFTDLLAERYEAWLELWDLEPPFIIADARVPPLNQWPRRSEVSATVAAKGETLVGVSGSPGTIRGRARIVLDPGDPGGLGPGDIMVAPLTDPAWTPLFMAVDGVIVNVGGQISHAIIVSRELGLPCVVSVEDATKRIPDGSIVEIDGTAGTVTVVDVPL
ncbi:MAG: PEP-utilizing enzyme [Acidimicrobiales bacterium]